MEYSQKISERLWNLPDKGELESRREETYIDDIVQKNHLERTLLSSLGGVRTVFDGGAAVETFRSWQPSITGSMMSSRATRTSGFSFSFSRASSPVPDSMTS